jgi:hypothetical protein
MMIESKICSTDRLRQEGRWEMATLWRDEKRKQLRAEGQTKAKSNEASWDAMLKQFTPIPQSDHAPAKGSSTGGLKLVDVVQGDYNGQPDLVRDTLWTYENLARRGVTPKDAPSLGAWSLLGWARESQDHFFEKMLPKAMAIGEKRPMHSTNTQELEDESEGKPPEDLFAVINREIREEREAVGKNTESDGGSWGMPVLPCHKDEAS